MRNRRNILDNAQFETARHQSSNGGFASASGSFRVNIYTAHAHVLGNPGAIARRLCCGERGRFSRTLESFRSAAGPNQRVAVLVRYRDNRVVECRFDMRNAMRNLFPRLALSASLRFSFTHGSASEISFAGSFPLAGDRFLRSLSDTRIGSRALTSDGKSATMPQTLPATDFHLPLDILDHLSP